MDLWMGVGWQNLRQAVWVYSPPHLHDFTASDKDLLSFKNDNSFIFIEKGLREQSESFKHLTKFGRGIK